MTNNCYFYFQVLYTTGRLVSRASRMNVESTVMGTTTGLSIARTGSPLFLLDDSLKLLQMCQKILPPPPVLPPKFFPSSTTRSWFPINSYTPCGTKQMEKVQGGGPGFGVMTLAQNTR